MLTVEGRVSVRGSEPFTALLLETDQRNTYVLSLEKKKRRALQNAAPGWIRVTGTLYKDDWRGQSYAHLRVQSWEAVER